MMSMPASAPRPFMRSTAEITAALMLCVFWKFSMTGLKPCDHGQIEFAGSLPCCVLFRFIGWVFRRVHEALINCSICCAVCLPCSVVGFGITVSACVPGTSCGGVRSMSLLAFFIMSKWR